MPVTSRDRGAAILIKGAAAARFKIKVGVLGNAEHKSADGQPQGITIAQLAEIHELGLGVTERSFLRAWAEANEEQVQNDLRAALRKILLGKLTPEQAAKIVGVRFVAGIQSFIAEGKVTPPLAQATIARKGSSVPLLDTNQLRSAITFAIESLFR